MSDILHCITSLQGAWYYVAQLMPAIVAAVVFLVLAWKTREYRHRVGLIWWLIPLEAISNAALAYDAAFWLWWRSIPVCSTYDGFDTAIHAVFLDGETKIIIGVTSILSIWVYWRIREGK